MAQIAPQKLTVLYSDASSTIPVLEPCCCRTDQLVSSGMLLIVDIFIEKYPVTFLTTSVCAMILVATVEPLYTRMKPYQNNYVYI